MLETLHFIVPATAELTAAKAAAFAAFSVSAISAAAGAAIASIWWWAAR